MTKLSNEFRRNHRAASEALIAATEDDRLEDIVRSLAEARHFEESAAAHLETRRQRALAMGLKHAVDLVEAVADAEFEGPPNR